MSNLKLFWPGALCSIDTIGLVLRYGFISIHQMVVTGAVAQILPRGSLQDFVLGGVSLGSRSMTHLVSVLAMSVGNVRALFTLDDRRRFPLPGYCIPCRFVGGSFPLGYQQMLVNDRCWWIGEWLSASVSTPVVTSFIAGLASMLSQNEAVPRFRLRTHTAEFVCHLFEPRTELLGFQDDQQLRNRDPMLYMHQTSWLLKDADHLLMSQDNAWDIMRKIRA
eukprot:CAMPEP_0171115294 /NCGR_PEP_ID=MMETSP0766_2-20121228/87447_1 /TAXON_ID=439317 /ORGANISM="Gambierdiscus australes, Strain CAWD 149" /LENGTH=220 /DNA_ID=CAMNT_0011577639 /DNA_START=117 /DNA_END=779 /DNA_ORIENTATION=+